MNTKPILFWPKPRSDIELHLDRAADDFSIVDTNSAYELQKLYKLRRDTAIFDPFPGCGEHYQEFSDHVVACDCRCHIVGLEACREVLSALKDPSLAHSSIEELLAAIKPDSGTVAPSSRGGTGSLVIVSRPSTIKQRLKMPIDWSHLNWANTSLSAILVFVSALIGNVLSFGNNLIATIVATFLFAALYVCVRAKLLKSLFSMVRRFNSGAKQSRINQRRRMA